MGSIAYVLCSFLSIFVNFETCFVHYKQQQVLNNNDENHKALFVFGDSLYDTGNNVYLKSEERGLSTYWPYGETFFHRATGRFSDGRLVPDFIAKFAGKPFPTPYLQPGRQDFTDGTSFAFAGSSVLISSTTNIDFPIQVMYFKNVTELLKEQLGEAEANKILADAVYLVSIGGVDYARFYSNYANANEESMRAFVKLVTGQLHKYLLEMTRVGAKKIAYQNVAPLGCSPSERLSDARCNEKLNFMASQHNEAIIEMMKEIEREVDGFKYTIFDYYTALLDRTFNPLRYGFKEGQVACCGEGSFRGNSTCGGYGVYPFELCKNPFDHVYWDSGGHQTEACNLQLSRLFWEGGSNNITHPYTVQQLFQL